MIIRNKCSDLSNDLYVNHIKEVPTCECGVDVENAEHYFFKCVRFAEQRLALFRATRQFHPLNTNKLLYGVASKTDAEILNLFSAIHQFIKALLTPTLQPVRDLFATDFFATDWRSMRLVQPLYAHIRIEDYNRRLVGDRFATGLRLIGDWLP